jgi:hypothetical protein
MNLVGGVTLAGRRTFEMSDKSLSFGGEIVVGVQEASPAGLSTVP